MFDLNNINGYEFTNKIYNKENDLNIYLLMHKIVIMDNDDIRSFKYDVKDPFI